MSSPERVIRGLVVDLEFWGIGQGATKRRAAIYWPARVAVFVYCCCRPQASTSVCQSQLPGDLHCAVAVIQCVQWVSIVEQGKPVHKLNLLWISAGGVESARVRPFLAFLEEHGIDHEFHLMPGEHTFINWRRCLHQFAPRLSWTGQRRGF